MRAAIVCNGDAPVRLGRDLAGFDLVVAADGGARHCAEAGVTPHIVVGDQDSASPERYPDFRFEHDPDQETNDLEKALAWAHRHHATDVVVFAATGARLDHTLKNLSVLRTWYDRFRSIRFRMNDGWIDLAGGDLRFATEPGQTISLFPLSGRVDAIRTTGLRYALHGEPLRNGVRDGSSNEATGTEVHIRHGAGDLLVIRYDLD